MDKPIDWRGSSLKDIKDDAVFSVDARKEAGHQLSQVQAGLEPDDWKPLDMKSSHKTPVGGNVFSDLGFESQQAEDLQRQSKRIISEKLAIKESLMAELSLWIDENNFKQIQAAQILGVTRPRVSDVIHKKTVKFTIDALVDMLARTGKQVRVSVQKT